MATWTPQTKHTSTWTNTTKHSSTWTLLANLLLENGGDLTQENGGLILIADTPARKHYSDWTTQTKH